MNNILGGQSVATTAPALVWRGLAAIPLRLSTTLSTGAGDKVAIKGLGGANPRGLDDERAGRPVTDQAGVATWLPPGPSPISPFPTLAAR